MFRTIRRIQRGASGLVNLRSCAPSVVIVDDEVTFIGFEATGFLKSFVLEEDLGQTRFWKTFKAIVKGAPAESATYEVKRVRRFLLRRKDKQALLEEVRFLRYLEHPRIQGIHLFYRNDPTYFYVVLEYMKGGELFDHLIGQTTYGEMQARDTCKILIDTLKHVHGEYIVHLNVSPSTLLLADPEDGTSIRLADFTRARSVRDGLVTSERISPEFVAPEILECEPHDTSVDMWNLGIVAHIILVGCHPFYHPDTTKMYRRVKEGGLEFRERVWVNLSNQAKDFVSKLLRVDPRERLTAAEAANHPWIASTNLRAATDNLTGMLDSFRLYQAKRKLRAAVDVFLAGRRFYSMLPAGDFSSTYALGEVLGKGTYAEVFKARAVAPSADGPRAYAVKRVDRQDLKEEDDQGIIDEVRILRELDHPKVVKIYDFYDNDTSFYYIVLELLEGGELFDRIVTMDRYSEEEARDACRDFFGALDYIHSQGVVHRDLKPENLLLVSKTDNTSIKLADFGLASTVVDGVVEDQLTVGTAPYMAPELIDGDPYGTAVDMWSAGVIIFNMLSGCYPFMDNNEFRLYAKIKKGNASYNHACWRVVSEDALSIVRGLLTVDPEQRLTARQAIQHPWLATSGQILSKNDLSFTLPRLSAFNAKRKLRAAINMVILAQRLHAGNEGRRSACSPALIG
ncbi:unnamed protein product [Ascophyllum nodosum]